MRIALLGTVPDASGSVRPELQDVLPEGAELSAWPSRAGVFPATPVEQHLQAIGHIEAGFRAAGAGADAVVIDSVGDYGLTALKTGLGIAAVGAGEAGLAAAAALGRFAIVTVWPASMNFVPEGLLRAYGHEDHCIGIRNVGAEQVIDRRDGPNGYLARVDRADPDVLSTVIAAIEATITEGAEAVLLGCTCMSRMAEQLATAVSVPVINPLAEAVKLAIAQAQEAPPPFKRLRSTRGPLLTRMIDAIAQEPDEQCPVCVVSDLVEAV